MKGATEHFSMSRLLEAPFHLVGQSVATTAVYKQILTHLILKTDRLIALIFTEASGHDKTELASSMGMLLEAPFIHIDYRETKNETDIFGPKFPYQGSQIRSRLNNYIASKDGERSIVFLDEFEKTDNEVRKGTPSTVG